MESERESSAGQWRFLGLHANSDNGVVEDVKKALKSMCEESDGQRRSFVFEVVLSAVRQNKVRLRAYREDEFVFVFVVGVHDRIMVKLATSSPHGFPRGFCLVFEQVHSPSNATRTAAIDSRPQDGPAGLKFVTISAFLDKFENDERTADTPLREFAGSTVRIAQKVSGSLSLVTAFAHRDQKIVLFTAKNSTGNVFTRECARLLRDWFRGHENREFDFYAHLADENLVCAFEVCSMAEGLGHHGSIYKSNYAVALVLGDRDSEDRILRPLADEKALPKLRDWGVPVLSRWISLSDRGRDSVLSQLISRRDFVTNSEFEAIIAQGVKDGHFAVLEGNISHSSLTDVLEGLVIWRSEKQMVKFKLPRYTVMTMCLRPLIGRHGSEISDSAARSQLDSFLGSWVLTEDGRQLYNELVRYTVHKLRTRGHRSEVTEASYLEMTEPFVEEFLANRESASKSVPAEKLSNPVQLFLVVGTVGWGKSTLMRQLREEYNLETISFDDCEENTKGGGSTKNVRVWGSAVFHLSRGRSVAIENGGGAFFGKEDQVVRNLVARCVSLPPIHLVLLCPVEMLTAKDEGDFKELRKVMLRRTGEVVAERFNIVEKRSGLPTYSLGKQSKTRERPVMGLFESEREAVGVLTGVSGKNFNFCRKLVDHCRRNNFDIVGYERRSGGGMTLTAALTPETPADVMPKQDYMLAIQSFAMLPGGERYTGHVTVLYGAGAEAADKFWAEKDRLTGRVSSSVLRASANEKETSQVAALVLDLPADHPSHTHFRASQIPHMSIESPYPSSRNNYVIESAMKSPGEWIAVDVDGREFLVVIDRTLSVEVDMYDPYCYVMM